MGKNGKTDKPRKSIQDKQVEREGEEEELLNRPVPSAKRVRVEDTSKPVRVSKKWPKEDEIVVLQGITDFATDKGESCFGVEGKIQFHEFLKRSLTLDTTPYLLSEKTRTMRRNHIMNEKCFSKAHDLVCLLLCRRIWQSDGKAFATCAISFNNSESLDGSEKNSDSGSLGDWLHHSFLLPAIAGLGLDQDSYKRGWCMVPVKEKKELEDKNILLQKQGSQIVIQKSQLVHEIVSVIETGSN